MAPAEPYRTGVGVCKMPRVDNMMYSLSKEDLSRYLPRSKMGREKLDRGKREIAAARGQQGGIGCLAGNEGVRGTPKSELRGSERNSVVVK